MKCQSCNHNDAEMTLSFRQEDQEWELHLCPSCAHGMQQFAAAAFQEYRKRLVAAAAGGRGMFSPEPVPHPAEPDPLPDAIPEDAGPEFRTRRLRNQLQAQLEEAVEREDFEQAAAIHKQLKKMKQEGVFTHD